MQLPFVKMHGCGNDYIYFDCLKHTVPKPASLAKQLSDRHFGIGGDGIVLICPSSVAAARMRMYNADGSEGKMCGNAIRCVGKYLYDSGYCKKRQITVETASGIKTLQMQIVGSRAVGATVDMGPPVWRPEQIPVDLPGARIVGTPVKVGGRRYEITCLSMGNPHCVVFLPAVEQLDLISLGRDFERSGLFPQGVNTEFVQVLGPDQLRMRVHERGSGETLACGTGACAAVCAAVAAGLCARNTEVQVQLRGGALTVRYAPETVYMTGPAEVAFTGTAEV